MSDRLQKWTALIVALGSLAGAVATGLQSAKQQAADEWVVRVLAEQLAEAGRRCP